MLFGIFVSLSATAATFVVTNTNDNGAGSLRQAILNANATSGPDVIQFNIPGAGVHTISPVASLPPITEQVTIDGYSQPGATANNLTNGDNAVLLIELNGSNTVATADGLRIANGVSNCVIVGLVINQFQDTAIFISPNASNNRIEGNFIGTDATGTIASGNGAGDPLTGGVLVEGPGNIIGGTTPSSRNLISGMSNVYSFGGVGLYADLATGNLVEGNFVGTDISGTKKLGNSVGVTFMTSHGNTVGGPSAAAKNVISGNVCGVKLAVDAKNNQVQGNYIGTDAGGATQIGNITGVGIQQGSSNNLIGGFSSGSGNLIAYSSSGVGIFDDTSIDNSILGNSIYASSDFGIGSINSYTTITSAVDHGGAGTAIKGNLINSPNMNFRVEFFASDKCESAGAGRQYLGFTTTTTDQKGNGLIDLTFMGTGAGRFITVTATDPAGTTSSFSNCALVQAFGVPSLSINDVSQAEGNSGTSNFAFTLSLSAAYSQPVSVNFATADGTATAGIDYQLNSGTVVFAPGEVSKAVNIAVNGDKQFEPDETFFVNLLSPVNATIAKAQGTGTILNDDSVPPPAIQFAQSNLTVQEGLVELHATVNRSGDTSGESSVDYATIDGTATQKGDFEYAAGTLVFAAGETSKNISVLINDDMLLEGNEHFNLELSNPAGASLAQQKTATITISDNVPESITNPIDDPQSFVHQHYHDFLNREPDAAGLAFWTNQITACGSDANCIESARNNVSAAFFLSIEFQQTGYLLYLMQKESFAASPKYMSFMRDVQELGRGVVVNAPGWQQQLVANQQAFASRWTNRPEFKTAFDNLANDAFVNAVYANAGIVPQQTQKDKLIAQLNSSAMTRSGVLLNIANDAGFRQQEQNRAFVLMEYFGYLRRDPNASPDTDMSGYTFWLDKLNQFGGNYLGAEMVKAFTNSSEYRQRFGP
jgi:hypothetical protein